MGNASAICDRHLGVKHFAPIGSGNLAIHGIKPRALSLFSRSTKAPAKIDSFSLKTAIRTFFYLLKTKLTELSSFREIIIEQNFPSR